MDIIELGEPVGKEIKDGDLTGMDCVVSSARLTGRSGRESV